MDTLKKTIKTFISNIRASITDDTERQNIMFYLTNSVMGIVSAFMTIVNIITQKRLLMFATLIFAIACLFNVLLFGKSKFTKQPVRILFLVEILILCTFFCVSGTPEGFSALWFCFLPAFGFFLFGRRRGSLLSGIGLLIIIFLFWFPSGKALLHYRYTDSFMLRFPMIYVAYCLMGFFVETIRAETQQQLVKAEKEYQYLYKHDALTGLFNRYGFNEQLDSAFANTAQNRISLMIIDIDRFKQVNDTYGHRVGDVVLCKLAKILKEQIGNLGEISRWGGEEFTVFLDGYYDAPAIAENIRDTMEKIEFTENGITFQVTISIGVCTARSKKNISIAKLVTKADNCLYQAKDAGRNKIVATEI